MTRLEVIPVASPEQMKRLEANNAALGMNIAASKATRAEIKKKKEALQAADEQLDTAVGRLMRWAKRVDDLRKKKKRITRELAKLIANS